MLRISWQHFQMLTVSHPHPSFKVHIKNTSHISSFHFIPFFILHNITTQYMLSFSVQKLSRSLWLTQAVVHRYQWKACKVFFMFFFDLFCLFFPLKNINFIRGPLKSSVCSLVSVCVCTSRKRLYSAVGKKGYCEIFYSFVCPPLAHPPPKPLS